VALASSRLAGVFDVGRDLPAEPAGILLAEVDLVFGAAQPEPQRLLRWTSIKVVFEFNNDPLRHPGLHDCDGLSAPYKISRHGVIIGPPTGRLSESMHLPGGVPGRLWDGNADRLCWRLAAMGGRHMASLAKPVLAEG
jgi:hypothetical protein